MTSSPAAPKPKRKRLPFAEMRARKELAERALDDIRNLLAEADPVGAPEDFARREKKAIELFDQMNALLPPIEPITDEERERMERELGDRPDDDTLRKVLLEMEKIIDDPAIPADVRDKISREDIRDALAALDEAQLLRPIARATEALADELRAPRPRDPGVAAQRRELEKQAAKRRS